MPFFVSPVWLAGWLTLRNRGKMFFGEGGGLRFGRRISCLGPEYMQRYIVSSPCARHTIVSRC